jgi:hypothetical protein
MFMQVGPKIGEGSFAVVHKGKEVAGQQRDVAIKIVRSQEELGLVKILNPHFFLFAQSLL